MPYSTMRKAKRAQPAPSAAQIRTRAIKRLLQIAEDESERPEAAIVACRVLLDLAPGRGRPAGEYGNIKRRQAAAQKILEEAFAATVSEYVVPSPDPPLQIEAPGATRMVEALPEPVTVEDVTAAVPTDEVASEEAEHADTEPSAPVRLPPEQVVPFAVRYGRRLNRGY